MPVEPPCHTSDECGFRTTNGKQGVLTSGKFRPPDIAPFENVRFRCAQGTWAWSEAVARLGGVPGKARLMDGGGRTAKRTRRREPGNTVAVWSRSSQRECTTRVRCGELSGPRVF